jgi:signal transduction histidine kinase
MSDSDYILIPASTEFIKLCQTQIILLSQNLGAVESAVYLTQTNQKQETKLIPIVVYPSNEDIETQEITLSLSPENSHLIYSSSYPFLPIHSDELNINQDREKEEQFWQHKYQLIVPLVYEDLFMGLLATRRKEREWTQQEFFAVEKIANTIALARILDRKQFLSQEKLKQQKQLYNLENNRREDFIHQIGNPLTALRTFAKLLLKKLNSKDPNYQITQNILRESDRLKYLIEDFREDRTKISSEPNFIELNQPSSIFLLEGNTGKLEIINIPDIIDPLLVGIKAICQEKTLNLLVNIAPNLPLIFAQKKPLIEILNNLLDNAIKYTPAGGKIYVEVSQQKIIENKEMLGIEISDTGYGIPAEDREHIFERHYRGRQEKSDISGTGLGLAIVKDLCDKMQAKIELFSPSLISNNDSLQGTTVIIWLLKA